MAKPRKAKNDDAAKSDNNSAALVRHQKLCLSIDLDRRQIHGSATSQTLSLSLSLSHVFLCQITHFLFVSCFFRHTELEIAVPEIGIVGLHAENLGIGSVLVDGEPAEFEYYPHPYARNVESDKRWSAVSTPSSAADVATSVYISALERELIPNLLINCCKGLKSVSVNEQPEQPPVVAENGFHPASEAKQQVIVSISGFRVSVVMLEI